jgi:hypothetical protein
MVVSIKIPNRRLLTAVFLFVDIVTLEAIQTKIHPLAQRLVDIKQTSEKRATPKSHPLFSPLNVVQIVVQIHSTTR